MRKFLLSVGALVSVGLVGCAALEPEPCSGDWVKWRTDQVTADFRQEFSGEMRDLAKFSRQLEDPNPFVLLQVAGRLQTLRQWRGNSPGLLCPSCAARLTSAAPR